MQYQRVWHISAQVHAIVNMVKYVIDVNWKESWTQYIFLWYSAHYFNLIRVYWFAICSK